MLRMGKPFTKVKFTVEKTDAREASDAMLGRKAKIHRRRPKAVAGLPDPDNHTPQGWRSTRSATDGPEMTPTRP